MFLSEVSSKQTWVDIAHKKRNTVHGLCSYLQARNCFVHRVKLQVPYYYYIRPFIILICHLLPCLKITDFYSTLIRIHIFPNVLLVNLIAYRSLLFIWVYICIVDEESVLFLSSHSSCADLACEKLAPKNM